MSNGRVILNDVEAIVLMTYLEQLVAKTANKDTAIMKILKSVIEKLRVQVAS